MAWHDRESKATVDRIVRTARRNERTTPPPVPPSGVSGSPPTRKWVQPPLPLEVDPPAPVEPPVRSPAVQVAIKSVRITPGRSSAFDVLVKAHHSEKGPVYRYGHADDLEGAWEVIQHILGSEYWTPDKYA